MDQSKMSLNLRCSAFAKYFVNTTDYIYTHTKVKQHHIVFGDTVWEVAEWNMWVTEIKYFEF